MIQASVVTEGNFSLNLLKKVIPGKIVKKTAFTMVPDAYSAQTLAQSILAMRQRPVALVMDAKTTYEASISERDDFSRWFLGQVAVGVPFEVFLVTPEMEIVFFQDRALLEQLLQRKVTDVEWAVGHFQPQNSLSDLLKNGSQTLTHEELLDRLTDEMIEVLQQHYPVREISEFLCSVVE